MSADILYVAHQIYYVQKNNNYNDPYDTNVRGKMSWEN